MSQQKRRPEPTGRLQYYTIVSPGRTRDNPAGLARRQPTVDGNVDEHLTRNLIWEPSSAIVEWELGDIGADLYEISEDEAMALIERWRVKWAAEGPR